MIEQVVLGGKVRAVIVRRDFHRNGVHFFTPGDFGQQLGYIAHATGHSIPPHTHREVQAPVQSTQEVLVLRKGTLRVDFYGEGTRRLASRELLGGDVILLASGGHGFEVLDDCEMFEIRAGPYVEGADKTRFAPDEIGDADQA